MTADAENLPRIKTVMLVDDERIDRMIYERVLQRSALVDDVIGFEYATDALEFLKQPDRPEVDVIFLDINMPRMSGLEFLEAATEEFGNRFARMIVVMLTTSLNPFDRQRASQFEVVRQFINKPLTEQHVRHVAALLSKKD